MPTKANKKDEPSALKRKMKNLQMFMRSKSKPASSSQPGANIFRSKSVDGVLVKDLSPASPPRFSAVIAPDVSESAEGEADDTAEAEASPPKVSSACVDNDAVTSQTVVPLPAVSASAPVPMTSSMTLVVPMHSGITTTTLTTTQANDNALNYHCVTQDTKPQLAADASEAVSKKLSEQLAGGLIENLTIELPVQTNGQTTEKLVQTGELEAKIRQKATDVHRVTVEGNNSNVDPKIIEELILEKMRSMGVLKEPNVQVQMGEIQAEPSVQLPETPGNAGFGSTTKNGPLAKFANFPSSPEAAGKLQTTTANNARFATKRSQVLSTRTTQSSTSEVKSSVTSSSSSTSTTKHQQSEAQGSHTELGSFNRKMSQPQLGGTTNGAPDVTSVTSAARAITASTQAASALSAVSVPPQTQQGQNPSSSSARTLQSQTSTSSLTSTSANVRQLTKSFDSLKSMSMDKLKDSLSMEKLDDRDLLTIDLTAAASDAADNDPSVKVFEQKQSYSTSNKKLVTNDFSTEEATQNSEEMTRLQEGDSSFRENKASADMRAKLEINGIKAEKGLSTRQEERRLKAGDVTHQESRSAAVAGAKLSTDGFSKQHVAMEQNEQRQTRAGHLLSQEQHTKKSSHSKVTINPQPGVTTPTSSAVKFAVEELERLERTTNRPDVEQAVFKCNGYMSQLLHGAEEQPNQTSMFDEMDVMLRKAWSVPTYGHELGNSLCDVLRNNGGLDMLIKTCNTGTKDVDLRSARVLEQCLTTENRQYVVDNGLDDVVRSACRTCSEAADGRESRVGSGILEHLFKHSEGTCSDVVRMGGLDAVITQCKNKDLETLRHCASALANLSLYGGPENQQAMIKRKVPTWLFPLAFHNDDNIKYYACLAITSMVANKEIEAAVLKSGTLDLVEPFVTSHDPDQFSKSTVAHVHGQSRTWLKRLVPVLLSDREEARKLAAFHFCMEAGIKIRQGCPEIFEEIGAIEPLKQVASSPNAVASKYAAQALRLLGQEVPHKLTQQVPLWSVEDVKEWVKQIHFSQYAESFVKSRMDGDLLLRMTEDMLRDDINMENGILRNRFMRELNNLKKMADYASCDSTGLNSFLQSISPEFSVYTYKMLTSGVDKDCLRYLTDDQLQFECDITNSIHRLRIHEAIKNESAPPEVSEDMDKTLDCFISYRRSNGSQLASLLKVHLELRGFSVFIDVERLEAGKFDNNLLNSIRQAQNFILVLTPSALDRCIRDHDQKDWVHKEVHAALQSKCNIIPIIDNFQWPEPEELPDDIKSICTFNGVRWIHDYQEACVDKLERFMRGESNRGEARFPPGGVRGHSPMGTVGPARAQSPCLSRGQSPGRWTPIRTPMSPLSPRRLLQYQRRASPVVSRDRRREMTRSRSLDAILDSESGHMVNESQFLSRSEDELGCCVDEDATQASSAAGGESAAAQTPPQTPGCETAADRNDSHPDREPSVASEASRDSDISRQGRKHKDSLVGRTFNKVRNMITKEGK